LALLLHFYIEPLVLGETELVSFVRAGWIGRKLALALVLHLFIVAG
jgi:hypothetical protein